MHHEKCKGRTSFPPHTPKMKRSGSPIPSEVSALPKTTCLLRPEFSDRLARRDGKGLLELLVAEQPDPFGTLAQLARAGGTHLREIFGLMEEQLDRADYETFITGARKADPYCPLTLVLLHRPTLANWELLLEYLELNVAPDPVNNILHYLLRRQWLPSSSGLALLKAILQQTHYEILGELFGLGDDASSSSSSSSCTHPNFLVALITQQSPEFRDYTELVLSTICRFAPDLLLRAVAQGWDLLTLLIRHRYFRILLALPAGLEPIDHRACLAACAQVGQRSVRDAIFSLPDVGPRLYFTLLEICEGGDEMVTPPLRNLVDELGDDPDYVEDWLWATRVDLLQNLEDLETAARTLSPGRFAEFLGPYTPLISPVVHYPFLANGQLSLAQLRLLRGSRGSCFPLDPSLRLSMLVESEEMLEALHRGARTRPSILWFTRGCGRFVVS